MHRQKFLSERSIPIYPDFASKDTVGDIIGRLILFLQAGIVATLTSMAFSSAAEETDQPPNARPPQLEEVIVTARRREERLQDVPVAVSSFSGTDLQNKVLLDVQDLTTTTPNLHMAESQGQANNPIISIRGQVQNDSSVLTLDPSVGVYLDEVYLGRTQGSLLDMFDIASVEVLKGPQGTLFGRNTTGGAIRIIPRKADPAEGWKGYVRAGAGNHGQQTLEGATNVPVAESLAFRIAYSQRNRDGYGEQFLYSKDNPEQLLDKRRIGQKESETWRANTVWSPADRIELELGYDSNDFDSNGNPLYDISGDLATTDDSGQINGYQRSSSDFYTHATDQRTSNNVDTAGWYIKGRHEVTWFFIKLIHAQRRVDYFFQIDIDGTNARGAEVNNQRQIIDQTSTELHFSGTILNDRLEYLLGLYDFEEKGSDRANIYVSELALAALGTPPPPAFPPGSIAIVDRTVSGRVFNESQSVFAHVSFDILPSLSVSGGIRRVKDTKGIDLSSFDSGALNQAVGPRSEDPLHLNTTENCIYFPDTEGATNDGENCRLKRSDDFYFTLYGSGMEWHPRDNLMAYFHTRRGARSGGQNFRGFNNETLQSFDPEVVTDLELGLKGEFLKRRLRVNLAAFRGDYKDFQSSRIILPVSVVENRGGANFEGFEVETTALITANLHINASGSHLNLEFDDEQQVQLHSPEWKWALGANYNWPLRWGTFNFNINYAWTGNVNMTISREASQNNPWSTEDSYGLLSARMAFNITEWDLEIAAFGNNLTDEKYQVNFLPQFIKPDPDEHATISPGRPRFYGLEVTKSFSLF